MLWIIGSVLLVLALVVALAPARRAYREFTPLAYRQRQALVQKDSGPADFVNLIALSSVHRPPAQPYDYEAEAD